MLRRSFIRHFQVIGNTSKYNQPKPFTPKLRVYQFYGSIKLSNVRFSSNAYWDYTIEHGPEHWQKHWNCNKRQSPVDIVTENVVHDKNLKTIQLDKSVTKIHVKNTGLNLSFPADNKEHIVLSGGPLEHNYAFREMHFHWGEVYNNKCELGCEHTIDGKRYVAEMHVVHWNTDLYDSEEEALQSQDGLAVIGLFLDANKSYKRNQSFNTIIEMFRRVPYVNMHSSFDVSPYFLFPQKTEKYYTYPGSLTTPPLTENVTWILFPQPVEISFNQLEEINLNHSHEKKNYSCLEKFSRQGSGFTITNNYRPTQPLNERTIRSSFNLLEKV